MTWIFLTLMAAFFQAWRNALQSELSDKLSIASVTLARFLLAAPIAIVYLVLLHFLLESDFIYPDLIAFKFVIGAAVFQIIATALMVQLFKQHNYATGAGLAKSEAVIAAVLGTLFFDSSLSGVGWLGVLIGGFAILLLSGFSLQKFCFKTAALGLLCGGSFAITSLWVREASLASSLTFPFGAAWVLASVICFQCFVLSVYVYGFERDSWAKIWVHRAPVALVGLSSCLGSIGWFGAMSLQQVAYVKTLGQLEIFFMMVIAYWWLKKPVSKSDFLSLILIASAAVLVMQTPGAS